MMYLQIDIEMFEQMLFSVLVADHLVLYRSGAESLPRGWSFYWLLEVPSILATARVYQVYNVSQFFPWTDEWELVVLLVLTSMLFLGTLIVFFFLNFYKIQISEMQWLILATRLASVLFCSTSLSRSENKYLVG